MHVLQLTTEFEPRIWGGIGRCVTGLCEGFNEAVSQTTVIVYDYLFGREEVEIEQRNGYTIVWTPTIEHAELAKWVDFETVDLVHVQIFFMAELAQKINKPIVYTVHSVEAEELRIRGIALTEDHHNNIRLQNLLFQEADKLIVCSESEGNIVEAYCPGAWERMHVIANGYQPEETGQVEEPRLAQFRRDLELDGAPTVLYVGRFSERKGVDVLVRAFRHVVQEVPNARLLVVGGHSGGDDHEFLAACMEGYTPELRERVTYAGWIDHFEDLQYYYASADVLAVPSIYEPFGCILLEAFYQRTPVVASRVGGMAEVIEHERSGLLVEARDEEALAQAIVRVLRDPELANTLAERAYELVRTQYNWSRIAGQTQQVYEMVLGTHSLT